MTSSHCFHCGLPNPKQPHLLTTEGDQLAFCCIGCQGAAKTIIESGLGDYYKFHQPDQNPVFIDLSDRQQQAFQILERNDIQAQFVHQISPNEHHAIFLIEGISCSACAWLIDKRLTQLNGVTKAHVNSATHRLLLEWDPNQIGLSEIAKTLFFIGYQVTPFLPSEEDTVIKRTQRQYILRLGIAGIGMMQAMMNAVALYSGQITQQHEQWLWWASLFLTVPVMLISARPFFTSAWQALRAKQLSMDVSVSLAILSAFFASLYATVIGHGEVYYESVNMFTFFLVLSRFLEFRARTQSNRNHHNQVTLPTLCKKILSEGELQTCSVTDLNVNDLIELQAGEACPVDGQLVSGTSEFDESTFTGEFTGVRKSVGDAVLAGSVNLAQPITLKVTALGANSSYNLIQRLIEQASQSKPRLALMADRGAQQFVWSTLIITLFIGLFWLYYDPDRAFWVVISVLVVTCPCALSLATPTALSQSLNQLKNIGFLLTKGYTIERLASIRTIAFDKTGTLTEGHFVVDHLERYPKLDSLDWTNDEVLALCHLLEKQSDHPIAKAFPKQASSSPIGINNIVYNAGLGVSAVASIGEIKLGNAQFTHQSEQPNNDTFLFLTLNTERLAAIRLKDRARASCSALFSELTKLNIQTNIISGDPNPKAANAFQELGLKGHYFFGAKPDDKLTILKQADKDSAFVGDGINDGPVLAGAHLSIAVNNATDLSKTQADAILLNDNLLTITQAIIIAKKTHRIIKQNLAWALVYNVVALPVAAMGLITPWQAAIGMSLSSLIVVGNAVRLRK
ncbi:cadmium-translocating P-type ATPase [Reinekea forsetii]|nr:cadmium-translocating P-type ATPase [Reinekea forsetii]